MKSGNKLWLSLLAVVLVVTLVPVFAGCTSSTPTPNPTTTTVPTASPVTTFTVKEWSFPNIGITTGPAAAFGLDAAWGVDRAVAQINKAGGINGKPIKVTRFDTAYDPAKAVVAMTQALGMNPLVIIGPMDDFSLEASGDLAIKAGVSVFSSVVADSRPRFAPWVPSLYPDSDTYAAAGIKEWLRLNPDIKTIVEFYLPQDPSHVRQLAAQEKALADSGVKIVAKIECNIGQIDFGPQATQALALKADGYYSHLNVMEQARLCQAFFQRGMTEGRRICCGAGATNAALFDVGKGFMESTYIWDCWDFTNTNPTYLEYVAAYKADHAGQFPYSMAITGQYEAVYAVKAAIEALKITGDPSKLAQERLAIRDYLWNARDLPGVQGNKWSYSNGRKVTPLVMYQIVNNQLKLISNTPQS